MNIINIIKTIITDITNNDNIISKVTDITFQPEKQNFRTPPFSIHVRLKTEEGKRTEYIAYTLRIKNNECELYKMSWVQEFIGTRYEEYFDKVPLYLATYTLENMELNFTELKALIKEHYAEFFDLSDSSERDNKKLYEKRR